MSVLRTIKSYQRTAAGAMDFGPRAARYSGKSGTQVGWGSR